MLEVITIPYKDYNLNKRKLDSAALAMAKGKTGRRLGDILSTQVDDFLYEFGILNQPQQKPDKPEE